MFCVNAQSEQYSFTPSGSVESNTVMVENLFSDLRVMGTNEGEIRIIAKGYEGLPEKAAGLKPLSAVGPDNTDIGLYVKQEGNIIKIAGASSRTSKADYEIYLPKRIKLKVDYSSFQAGDIKFSGLSNEVEVKSQIGELIFEMVTGPIIASTLSADITVYFKELNQVGPTSITSTSGDIDISVPSDTKGNFEMSTTSGEVYTDLEFSFNEENGLRRWGGGMSADANLNGGGSKVTLRSVSGDIFIRKLDQ